MSISQLSDDWKDALTKPLYYLFESSAREHADKVAIIDGAERFTYREYLRAVEGMAKGLYAIGVRPGDHVAIWMSNRIEWACLRFAIYKLGAVLIPLSTRYGYEDVKYVLRDSDARALVMEPTFLGKFNALEMLSELCPEVMSPPPFRSANFPFLWSVICLGEEKAPGCLTLDEMLQLGQTVGEQATSVTLHPDDLIHMVYTSGTTGFPKGVMTPNTISAAKYTLQAEFHHLESDDRYLQTTPFFSNMGLTLLMICPMKGATLVVMKRWDAETAMALIEKEKIKHAIFVPTMLADILSHPKFHEYDLSSLRYVTIGGALVPPKLARDARSKMSLELMNVYGLVEGSGITSGVPAADTEEHVTNTVGLPWPYCKVVIVDPATGEFLAPGKEGEICTSEAVPGSQHMRGYYKQEELTAETIREGLLHSGDLGLVREDGYLVVTGRLKEQFHVGGFNVSPAEVENFLLSHPKIEEVAVAGVPDERLGEVCAAFIRLKKGETASPEDIIAFCQGKIANIKVPRYVFFVDSFPMTASGKVQRFKLREQFIREQEGRK